MGITLFWREPTSQAMRAFLGRVMHKARAKPWALVRSKPGVRIGLDIPFQAGRRHLPLVRVRPVKSRRTSTVPLFPAADGCGKISW